ncbi:MAG: tetratricopeptide repeat protein [Gammaproteobacteria bacterium SHHR-1]|uniref:YfgM family protein n=1 Tax=Magnetovirga frankeli TaxID=947516 RepID=UPI001293ADC7|nr:tetratricopeptide repeat protein [gamma proteobacterium SS-5]
MAYETDEQQAEALKQWWAENGKQVIFGIVIGLVGVFGWRGWQEHRADVNASAAQALGQMLEISGQGETDQALVQGQKIIDEYANTLYADLASLNLAAALVGRGEEAAALAHLQRVIEQRRDPALTDLARLRLARLLLSLERAEEARALLDSIGKAYAAEVESIRGDIALAAGDLEAARQAYERALAEGLADTDMIRLKLDDLAGTQASQ